MTECRDKQGALREDSAMPRIVKVWDFTERNIPGNVATLLLGIGLAVAIMEVFCRYLLGWSFAWTNEAVVLLFMMAIFIYFGLALKADYHIRVKLLIERLAVMPREILRIVATDIVGIIFCVIVVKHGLALVSEVKRLGFTTEVLEIPTAVPYFALVLGFVLLAIGFLIDIYNSLATLFRQEPEIKPGKHNN